MNLQMNLIDFDAFEPNVFFHWLNLDALRRSTFIFSSIILLAPQSLFFSPVLECLKYFFYFTKIKIKWINIYILLSTAKGKAEQNEQNQHRVDTDLSNDLSLIFFLTLCVDLL